MLRLAVVLLLAMIAPVPGPGATNNPDRPVDYFIIVTGGEILEGAFADSHTLFITKTLRPLGLRCVGMMIVDDLDEDLRSGLRYATNKADLVLTTGGLGPTDNDITRQTLAKFSGIPVREEPELLKEMSRRLNTPVEQLRANLRRQTETPTRGAFLKNRQGTAAGLVFDMDTATIIALPGPPRELQPMVREELAPYLSRRFGLRSNGASVTLRFLGLGQSQIDQTIKEHLPMAPGIRTSSQFENGRVDFTFSLPDDSPDARAKLTALRNELYKHLGGHIYADDSTTLEETVAAILQQNKGTLALAEIGSAGALSAALGKVAAKEQILAGDWVAPAEAVLYRTLKCPPEQWRQWPDGLPRLKETARLIAAQTEATHALVVGPAVRQAANGADEIIAVLRAPGDRWESQTFYLRGTDDVARGHLVSQLLGFLWKKVPPSP